MAEVLGTGEIDIEVDVTVANAQTQNLANRIERVLDAAARNAGESITRHVGRALERLSPATIVITADTRPFDAALNRYNNLGSSPLRVTPDVDRAAFEAAIQSQLDGLEVSVRVVPDLSGVNDRIRAHRVPPIEIETRVDNDRLQRSLAGLAGSLGKGASLLGKATTGLLAFGAAGIAGASSIVTLVSAINALAPAVGIVAALPAVALGAAAAIGALKIALSGVGDAFKAGLSGDAKAFEKSLEGLSPAAQRTAREVRALKPAFDDLKKTVQDSFFRKIEGDLKATAEALGGPLKTGLADIAGAWGRAAESALKYVRSGDGVSDIQLILEGTGQAVDGLARGSDELTQGFLRAAASISEAFGTRAGNAISDLSIRFGTFLDTAASDGRLEFWVQNAIGVLKTLGSVLGNIGGILSGVFAAASNVSGGFLENIKTVTQSVEDFVNTTSGQQAIGNIFSVLSTIAAQLGPILTALVAQVGAIAPGLTSIFTSIGPAITTLISTIGPLIQGILPGIQDLAGGIAVAFAKIAETGAFATLGKAIGDVMSAIEPLLPVIGVLVGELVSSLAPVLSTIVSAVAPVVSVLGSVLPPILSSVGEAFRALVTAISPVIELIGNTLASVIEAVAPIFVTLADTFTQVFTALTPLIAQLVSGLAPIFAQLAPLIAAVVAAVAPLIEQFITALLPALPPIIEAFVAIFAALTPIIPAVIGVVNALAPLLAMLVSLLGPIVTFAAEILKWVSINAVVPIIETVITVVLKIIQAVTDVLAGVKYFVETTISFFANLGTNVSNLVSSLVSGLKSFFSDLWASIKSGTSDMVSAVVGFFVGMYNGARAQVASLVSGITNYFSDLYTSVRAKVSSLVDSVVEFFSGLPGRARSALGSLGGYLYDAGSDLMRGLINGVKAVATGLVDAVLAPVRNAVSAVKNFLDIQSPSKLMYQIGVYTGQGLINGLDSMASAVGNAATDMAAAVVAPFSGLTVGGPTVGGVSGGLGRITQPYGIGAPQTLPTTVSRRQAGGQAGGATVSNVFNITEVGNADATAQRVVNRLVGAAGVYL